ncbi:aminoglycoside phosphotransferase [[Actinomadura] parvosata subsp. kistnae]|uniref:phosphotransferase n=1 Tax=[Actinomadura] parvosata TaxID=1955412 RepID=UPI000D2CC849|nr:aminoglycoside phosphotransferase family protein [Nonomuraea sp. ATCC 55076]SPM00053.1 aminoglycoside phosphotransferase [Actinomadura parvosata subsp. kistnae]
MPENEEVVLAGGGVNHVVRAGATVRRPAGPWTPAVHRLLRHLEAQGFAGAPRCHGLDERGREVLDFVPGETAGYPLPGWVRTDEALAGVARLLRGYHDATVGCSRAGEWYFPPVEPAAVICHGDVAPYNCVFRRGGPVAFIDFDTAHPGPRVWDVAYAAYRFVPLHDPGDGDGIPVGEQARRLRLFADAYGLGADDRAALVETAVKRLEHLVRFMRERAAAGDAAFAGHVARGDDRFYEMNMEHLRRSESALIFELTCRSPR